VLPQLQALDGFRGLICGADRDTGDAYVSTVWENDATRQASDTGMAQQRQEALERFGATNVTVQNLEAAFVELQAPVTN
jgi:hypothetical protein